VSERALLERRLREHRQRSRKVAVDLELHCRREVARGSGPACRRATIARIERDEPQLRDVARQSRMVGWLQDRFGWCRRRGRLGGQRARSCQKRNGKRAQSDGGFFYVNCRSVASPSASVRTSSSRK
jgi:hypothetical protein